MKREDDYGRRRAHLSAMTDEELKKYFWSLAAAITEPCLKLGYENTSPSIERSVLLRMGFSSIEVKPIVEGAMARNLLGHGAGNIVYRLSRQKKIGIREAGLALAQGELWEEAVSLFQEVG